jgi:hypothetical protein
MVEPFFPPFQNTVCVCLLVRSSTSNSIQAHRSVAAFVFHVLRLTATDAGQTRRSEKRQTISLQGLRAVPLYVSPASTLSNRHWPLLVKNCTRNWKCLRPRAKYFNTVSRYWITMFTPEVAQQQKRDPAVPLQQRCPPYATSDHLHIPTHEDDYDLHSMKQVPHNRTELADRANSSCQKHVCITATHFPPVAIFPGVQFV